MLVEANEMQLTVELIEALGAASADASVMVHQHADLRWAVLSDSLRFTKNGMASLAATMLTLPKTVIVDKVN